MQFIDCCTIAVRDLLVRHYCSRIKAEVLHGPRYPSHFILFPSMGVKRKRLGVSGGRSAGARTGRPVQLPRLPGCLPVFCLLLQGGKWGKRTQYRVQRSWSSPQSNQQPGCSAQKWLAVSLQVAGTLWDVFPRHITKATFNGSCENPWPQLPDNPFRSFASMWENNAEKVSWSSKSQKDSPFGFLLHLTANGIH